MGFVLEYHINIQRIIRPTMFSTRYYDADDLFGYHRLYGRQQRYNQHQHHNEDSYERYLRMKEQEHLEAAYARRRRRELYEHRRQQALLEREQKLREWKRQQQLLAYQQQQQEYTEDHNDDDNDYGIEIVRGRDGNLYYVKRQKPQHKVQPKITEEIPAHHPTTTTNSIQRRGFHSDRIVEEDSNDFVESSEDS